MTSMTTASPGLRRDWFTASSARGLREASAFSYEEYVCRAMERVAGDTELEEDQQQIELDLARIGDSVAQYLLHEHDVEHTESKYVDAVRRVLMAYTLRNRRVGYIQGHADVLCFLLANTSTWCNEEEAFWIYACVIEEVFPDDFFARTPKLHGFHVDVKLLSELIAKRLMPHIPQLAAVDLSMITSLLACKWFVCLWVGELPTSLLVPVWEFMLCDADGTFLHLLLALHMVRLAADALAATGETDEPWDSSFLYKELLESCRALPDADFRALFDQASAVYNLSDEGVEDMRAAIRADSHFRAQEARVLMKTVHFDSTQLLRLHDEFLFARMYAKVCDRRRLRGVRRDFIDLLLSREFPMLNAELHRRISDHIPSDAIGNVSFFNLIQALSVLHYGTPKERASLLFSLVDRGERKRLTPTEMSELAELLCGLAISAATGAQVSWPAKPSATTTRRNSPLLHEHFLVQLKQISASNQSSKELTRDEWIQYVLRTPDLHQLVSDWGRFDKQMSPVSGRRHRTHRSKSSPSEQRLKNGEDAVQQIQMSEELQYLRSRAFSDEYGRMSPPKPKTVSLLSNRMKKKYNKLSQHSAFFLSASNDPQLEFRNQVYWCQCSIS
ncbi:hypothetical protein Poli38472_014805 [Pythium oligandrum]|uniref:Rab-GAP TBC domain-containing protein n=1 Tax=Pythium oligandrum TaxID=41045 RepID=A0A8K1CIK8_PYTOL|nr:hypothetical protein Poli38472_014805 [Pythium oligandrum]|eukprot:TMW63895.1 hypothetical protein Poli38472_014805 [Pythium oligandrum]